jgi:hypothetical protein
VQMPHRVRTTLLIAAMSCATVCAHESIQPFSSDVKFTANGQETTGRVYSDGQSIRMELDPKMPNGRAIFIRLETGLAQDVSFREQFYAEYPYGAAADAQFIPYLQIAYVKSELLGTESFDGQECEKVEVTSTYKGQVYASIQWRSKPLHGFVVKTQDVQGEWSAEYKNVKLGDQPAALFEIPVGYNRIAFSRDWKPVVQQIERAGGSSQEIEIAQKAGLEVKKGEETPSFQSVSFIDPVTKNTVLDISINVDTF